MELSILLTAHNEGLIAHKTLLSLFRALENYSAKYEILVNIDNGSSETKKYFRRYKDDARFRIFENHFGDAGASRNFLAQQAKGKYALFLDADDLISKNYITGIMEILRAAKGPTIAHPETCITFEDGGEEYLIWKTTNSGTREQDAFKLFERNCWVSSSAAKREIFLKHPYILTQDGFGHEDYTFSIETVNAGIKHRVAPGSLYFYRNKPISLRHANNLETKIQPYSELFDYKFWQTLTIQPNDLVKPRNLTLTQRLKQTYIDARRNPRINQMVEPLANAARKVIKKPLISVRLPEATFQEWAEIAKIEQQIYPTQNKLKLLIHYNSEANCYLSYAYEQLCKQVQGYPDYVFLVPWVMPGGADKVLLNYVRAIQELHPEWKVAVITTTPTSNAWAKKLPDNAYLLDMGNTFRNTQHDDPEIFLEMQMELLSRLLVQLKVKKLHIINALLGYEWVRQHMEYTQKHMEVYLSLFCYDILPNTKGKGSWDYADPYALRIDAAVKRIYTDNEAVVKKLVEIDGFDAEKIRVHYQPVEELPEIQRVEKTGKKLNILWASRIAPQKNPELLLQIAKKLDARQVHIDAYGRRDGDYPAGFFPKSVRAITYHGAFSNIKALDLSKYDLFLYTSLIDGVPNIVLEMASAGLPIIASDAGGVRNFIENGKTGILIEDLNNADAYVAAIERVRQNPAILDELVKNAQQKVATQHSWEAFIEAVKPDLQ